MSLPTLGRLSALKLRELEYWVRYINDAYAIIKKTNSENKIPRELNSIDQKVKITTEIEKDCFINYLDTKTTKTRKQKLENHCLQKI